MGLKKVLSLCGFVIIAMAITFIAFAEESSSVLTDSVITSEQQDTSKNANDIQWAWGEVTDVNTQANTLTLKYLDYETDQEKELVLTINENTVFENINGLDEIKSKDTLSIDYIAPGDGNNIAKNINFENKDVSDISSVQDAAVIAAAPAVEVEPAAEEAPSAIETVQESAKDAEMPQPEISQPETVVEPSVEIEEPAPAATEPQVQQ